MSTVASLLMLAGGLVALLAGLGVLRFTTPYARFHAAGKASPVAFLVAATGAGIELGPSGAAYLMIAAAAMIMTLPVGVHLLFRAVHRTTPGAHLLVDDLAEPEAAADAARDRGAGGPAAGIGGDRVPVDPTDRPGDTTNLSFDASTAQESPDA